VVGLLQLPPDALARFLTDDERGRQLPNYLTQLAEHLTNERAELKSECERMAATLRHVGDILQAQSALARGADASEPMQAMALLQGAATVVAAAFHRYEIELMVEVDPAIGAAPLQIDRVAATQILVNLLTNASEALRDRPPPRRVTLRCAPDPEAGWTTVTVEDNGCGIDPEILPHLFEIGFTTRPTGQGLGLHFSASTTAELGGRLRVTSEGPGAGATFTLELPSGRNADRPRSNPGDNPELSAVQWTKMRREPGGAMP
jgi:signal transduction histidine kinase